MNAWFEQNFVCPQDHGQFDFFGDKLICSKGHEYPCVDGIPIMLVQEPKPTHASHFRESYETTSLSEGDPKDVLDEKSIDSHVQQISKKRIWIYSVQNIEWLFIFQNSWKK